MAVDHRANNFNLIRLLLASAVILAHSPEIIDGDRHRELVARVFGDWVSLGTLAVDGFFILSGYLIAQSWVHDSRIPDYLWKRIVRIYPGFVVAGLISGLVLAPLGTRPDYWQEFSPRRFVAGLVKLTLRVPDAFAGLPFPLINAPVWTIRYEFSCYLALMVLGACGLARHRRTALLLASAATAWAGLQALGLIPPIQLYRLANPNDSQLPRLLACFGAGSVYFLHRDRLRFRAPLVLLAAAALAWALFREAAGRVLIPWLGGYLLLAAGHATVVPGTAWVRRDDISYGIYLYAWPIQILLVARMGVTNPWLLFLFSFLLAIVAGFLSWRLVEKPCLRLKSFRRPAGSRSGPEAAQPPGPVPALVSDQTLVP